MTIAANFANIEFGVSDAKLNPKARSGTSRAESARERSFGERWQSLVDLDSTAGGKKVVTQAVGLEQCPAFTIADLQDGLGATNRPNHSGEIETHPRVRPQNAEGSQHQAPSTKQEMGIGTIEVDPTGTPLVPMIQWQSVVPEPCRTMNANQQTSCIESTLPIGARQMRFNDLIEANLVRQGTGDIRSSAAPPTHEMALRSMDVTNQPGFAAQKGSEADENCEAVESTERLSGPSIAGHVFCARTHGPDSPATNVANPQVETAAVAPDPAASDKEIDIRNATEAVIRPAATPKKGRAPGDPSTPSEQPSSAHFASGQAAQNLTGHPGQFSQQQLDAGLAHSSNVPAVPTREPASFPSQTAPSPSSTTVHQTFAALDAENSTATSKWVHAGRNTAEAGFEDPVLGWVGVRAQAASAAYMRRWCQFP